MNKILKIKYIILGFILGIGIIWFGTYAAITGGGTIGSLFEKIGNVYKLRGDEIKDNTVDNSEIENDEFYQIGKLGIGVFPSNTVDIAIGDNDTGLKQQGDGNLAIFTNNSEKVIVNSSGNVGIGTSNPQNKLDVIGNVRAYELHTNKLCDYYGNNCININTINVGTINGICGDSNGGTFSTQPTNNLCLSGTVVWVDTIATDGTYNWTCQGQNGGTNASCSATKSHICGNPISIIGVDGIVYTYDTKLMPDGKCWTSQDMIHPVRNPLGNLIYPFSGKYYKWKDIMGCDNSLSCVSENLDNSLCGQLGSGWHLPSIGQITNAGFKGLATSLGCNWSVYYGYICPGLGWTGNKLGGLINTQAGSTYNTIFATEFRGGYATSVGGYGEYARGARGYYFFGNNYMYGGFFSKDFYYVAICVKD